MATYDLGKVVGDKGDKGDKGDTGATGNGIQNIVLRSTVGKVKTYRITFTNGNTFDFQVTDGEDGSGATVEIVTSWNSTTSDTKVPSEKLAKTSLDGKAPTSHASSSSTYGLGTTANYGHVKTINELTQSSHSNGTALSAYQGYVLKGLIDAKPSSSDIPTKTSDLTNDGDGTNAFLTQHQSLINYVQKSNTAGLIKNDGTIDTNAYITNSALTNYIQKSNTSGLVKNDGSIDTNTYLTQMKVGSTANYIVYTTTNGVLASKEKLGNINYLGRIGSTANKPLITTTNGTITTGSFGTSANSFCEGNDSRLSDARTPTAHTHTVSNITDFPSIPSKTSDLTNDGADGTNVFVANNDSRLSDARTPTSHTHGNLTNDGKISSRSDYFVYTGSDGTLTVKDKIGYINVKGQIGTVSGKPLITTTNGTITTGSFGTSSGTFAEGNHTHSNYISTSSTTGLVKNDGSIDTNTYLTSSALANYVQKSSTTGLIKNDGTIMTGGTGSTNYAIGNHTHGLISADGEIDDTNSSSGTMYKLIGYKSDATSKKIRALANVYGRYVVDNTAHSNIGSSVGSHQETINGLIDTALGSKLSATKVTSWSSTVSDSNVPSEKLVSDTFDAIEDLIGDAIQYINQ